MNDLFRRIRGRLGDGAHEKDRAYENARVRFMVARLGMGRAAHTLADRHAELYGSRGLTFGVFAEEYPDFPVLLAASTLGGVELHQDNRSVFPNWYRRFPDLPFVAPFEAHLERVAGKVRSGFAAGLVFPRKGFGQGLVVHTDVPSAEFGRGGCFTYRGGTRGRPVELHVRPFSDLVDAVRAGGWSAGAGS